MVHCCTSVGPALVARWDVPRPGRARFRARKNSYPRNPPSHYTQLMDIPVNRTSWPIGVSMLAHRLRRWSNIETPMGQPVLFLGWFSSRRSRNKQDYSRGRIQQGCLYPVHSAEGLDLSNERQGARLLCCPGISRNAVRIYKDARIPWSRDADGDPCASVKSWNMGVFLFTSLFTGLHDSVWFGLTIY